MLDILTLLFIEETHLAVGPSKKPGKYSMLEDVDQKGRPACALSRIRRPDRHRLAQTKPRCGGPSAFPQRTWVWFGTKESNEPGAAQNRVCLVWSRIEPHKVEASFTRFCRARPLQDNSLHGPHRQPHQFAARCWMSSRSCLGTALGVVAFRKFHLLCVHYNSSQ